MTFGELMREHHTILSLLLGVIITSAVFLIPKLNKTLKVLIIFVLMFVLTGLIGVLKYLGLVAAIAIIVYGAFGSISTIGLLGIFLFMLSQGWKLQWWKAILIGAAWTPIAMLIDLIKMYVMLFLAQALKIPAERLPRRIRLRLENRGE